MKGYGDYRRGEEPLKPEDTPTGDTHMNEALWGDKLVKSFRAQAERRQAEAGESPGERKQLPPEIERIKELSDIENQSVTFQIQWIHAIPFLYFGYLTYAFLSDPFDDGETYVRYRDRVSSYRD